jgi:hypothetical protein
VPFQLLIDTFNNENETDPMEHDLSSASLHQPDRPSTSEEQIHVTIDDQIHEASHEQRTDSHSDERDTDTPPLTLISTAAISCAKSVVQTCLKHVGKCKHSSPYCLRKS